MCAEQTNFPQCSTTMQHHGQEIDVVWFKRDLRIRDHAPLAQALRKGRRVLLLHTYEPQGLAHPTTSNRHLRFRWQAWTGLCAEVNALGWPVQTAVLLAPALEVFQYLHNSVGIRALYSYEETGLAHTFDRDKEIDRWARDNGIDWQEHRQQAVHRGLKHRKQWANDWHKTMHSPVTLATPGPELENSMCRIGRILALRLRPKRQPRYGSRRQRTLPKGRRARGPSVPEDVF